MTPQRARKRADRLMSRIVGRKPYGDYSQERFNAAYWRYLSARRRGLATGAFTQFGPGPRWLRELRVKLKNPEL